MNIPNENNTVQQPEQADTTIMDQALEWVVRLAEASPEEREAFILWIDTSAEHAAAFEQAESVWHSELVGVAAARVETRLGAPRAIPRRASRTWRWSGWAAAASVLLAVLLVWQGDPRIRLQADYLTSRGEQRQLPLEDGSAVLLGSDSALAMDFLEQTREARLLRGDAYFEVARDAHRPFLIEAGTARIRVVGTAFSVRYRDERVQVSVNHGLVEVSDVEGTSLRLAAGQEVEMVDGHLRPLHSMNTDQALAWTKGRMVFENRQLGDIVAELRHHYPGWIVISDAQLSAQAITGNYRLDTPRNTLHALAELTGARVSEWPGVLVLHR